MSPSVSVQSHLNPSRIVLHALPPLAFVGCYVVTQDMQTSAEALVGGAAASLLIGIALERRLLVLPLVLGLFGIATALLAATVHPDILKLKAVVVHATIGLVLLSFVAFRHEPFSRLVGPGVLTRQGWRRLTLVFGLLQVALAIANIVIWHTLPEKIWVAFHFPISPLLHVLVLATQAGWLRRDHATARAALAEDPNTLP